MNHSKKLKSKKLKSKKLKENDVVVLKKDFGDWIFGSVSQNITEGDIGLVKVTLGETVWIQVNCDDSYVRFQCYINEIEKIGIL